MIVFTCKLSTKLIIEVVSTRFLQTVCGRIATKLKRNLGEGVRDPPPGPPPPTAEDHWPTGRKNRRKR